MTSMQAKAERLHWQINHTKAALNNLKAELSDLESRRSNHESEHPPPPAHPSIEQNAPGEGTIHPWNPRSPLTPADYKRYGRQMILPQVGIEGQIALNSHSILVVGLGGLGCPAATYLAAAGIARLGLVDGDVVEFSNLHRQILHTPDKVGMLKVESAAAYLETQNPDVQFECHPFNISPSTAVDLFERYDVILDCTDNPMSRYLISDAAVLARRPLISASALKTEGQLLVLNEPPSTNSASCPKNSFCYRCIFPKPPPAESVATCGEAGVLGPVVGTLGVLMAAEALKILFKPQSEVDAIASENTTLQPSLLLYSAYSPTPFRTVRLGGRRRNCPSCSEKPLITRDALLSGSLDYVAFCGARNAFKVLGDDERISATEYNRVTTAREQKSLLIDVRENTEFSLAHLAGSLNLPFSDISADPEAAFESLSKRVTGEYADKESPLYFVCRFGNDSQLAIQKFKEVSSKTGSGAERRTQDIKGGLEAWRREVDSGFPKY